MDHFDVAIIGAGFGGLSCALGLAARGATVAIFERLAYPGGCASTFSRQGYRFESGATLFSGFGPEQLFRGWIDDYGLDVDFRLLDPVVELRTPTFTLDIPPNRHQFIDRLCALDGAPQEAIRDFFDWQKAVADGLWELFDDPSLLPPFTITNLTRHLFRSPRYIPMLRAMNRSLAEVLKARGLWQFRPLRTYLDAVCQITVQTDAETAEAPFALAAMDYFFRGTGHIHNGIGQFADALAETIESMGVKFNFADAVWKAHRRDHQWRIESRRREITADRLVANLLPQNLADILGKPPAHWPILYELNRQVETGWGAAMLYRGLDASTLTTDEAHHLELIADEDAPFREGNHLFCSVASADETDRAPAGQRVLTASTHVDMNRLWQGDNPDQAHYIDAIHHQMRETIADRAPRLAQATVFEMTASPRTFELFTNRHRGYVGGIPRTVGLHNYRQLGPLQVDDDLYLVGDTVFPGQSTLAVALGGLRTAQAIA